MRVIVRLCAMSKEQDCKSDQSAYGHPWTVSVNYKSSWRGSKGVYEAAGTNPKLTSSSWTGRLLGLRRFGLLFTMKRSNARMASASVSSRAAVAMAASRAASAYAQLFERV
eukprot:5687920-Pleurochrysis_carterae.AAC.1